MCFVSNNNLPNDEETLRNLIQEEIKNLNKINEKITNLKAPELSLPKFSFSRSSIVKSKTSITLHNRIVINRQIVCYQLHPTRPYFFVGCEKEIFLFTFPAISNPINIRFPQINLKLVKFISISATELVILFDNNTLMQYSTETKHWYEFFYTYDPIISIHSSEKFIVIQFPHKLKLIPLNGDHSFYLLIQDAQILRACIPNKSNFSMLLTSSNSILLYSLISRDLIFELPASDNVRFTCNSQWTHFVTYSCSSATVYSTTNFLRLFEIKAPIRMLSTDGSVIAVLLSDSTAIAFYDASLAAEVARLHLHDDVSVAGIEITKVGRREYNIVIDEGGGEFTLWNYSHPVEEMETASTISQWNTQPQQPQIKKIMAPPQFIARTGSSADASAERNVNPQIKFPVVDSHHTMQAQNVVDGRPGLKVNTCVVRSVVVTQKSKKG